MVEEREEREALLFDEVSEEDCKLEVLLVLALFRFLPEPDEVVVVEEVVEDEFEAELLRLREDEEPF